MDEEVGEAGGEARSGKRGERLVVNYFIVISSIHTSHKIKPDVDI